MAITTQIPEIPKSITTHFNNLEEQKTLLINCTNLYKTLTNHFTALQNTLNFKLQTLDSKSQTLDSSLNQSLDLLKVRECAITEMLESSRNEVELRRNVAVSELSKAVPNDSTQLGDILSSTCRRMDPGLLMRLLVEKRRETATLREKMSVAFSECVDSGRFVVDAVKVFVEMKREKRAGLIDTRWACSMLVRSMFPPEELKVGQSKCAFLGRVFAKKAVQRAEEVLREWREAAENERVGEEGEGGGDGTGMGPAEAAMFIEVLLGFGLKERFEDDEFYRKLMVEFCGRRDMAKLAVPLFGDRIADLIEELMKNGKEVEAVHFAYESGLTERFQPVSLLKTSLQKSRKETADTLKKGNNSSSAMDKANSLESSSIRSIIKCVEEHKLEEQFSVDGLRKRLAVLEKAKNDRKKGPTASHSKGPHTDRTRIRDRDRTRQTSGPPPPRPAKLQKLSSPYTAFAGRDQVLPAPLSPVSKYLGPSTYPSQTAYPSQTVYPSQNTYPSLTTYDTGVAASAYTPSYSGSQIPASAVPAATVQHYGVLGDSVATRSAEARVGGSYGSQVGYASYDYDAAAAAYHPPSYPQ
ncbi:hypothetical protein vseg_000521 [Gypsophila vaccaria]